MLEEQLDNFKKKAKFKYLENGFLQPIIISDYGYASTGNFALMPLDKVLLFEDDDYFDDIVDMLLGHIRKREMSEFVLITESSSLLVIQHSNWKQDDYYITSVKDLDSWDFFSNDSKRHYNFNPYSKKNFDFLFLRANFSFN